MDSPLKEHFAGDGNAHSGKQRLASPGDELPAVSFFKGS